MTPERNTEARDKLVAEITKAMDTIRPRLDDIGVALDYLEQARSQCYTAPMAEVKTILIIAKKRLTFNMDRYRTNIHNIAEVANQIAIGEFNEHL